jgi:hypothetical protein
METDASMPCWQGNRLNVCSRDGQQLVIRKVKAAMSMTEIDVLQEIGHETGIAP